MNRLINLQAHIDPDHAGQRLDAVLAELWPDYSRSRIAAWIRGGQVRVNEQTVKPGMRLLGGELIRLHAELADHGTLEPQSIALEVLLEDPHLLVVNKPAGLVVHPGSGNPDGTLANALLKDRKSTRLNSSHVAISYAVFCLK